MNDAHRLLSALFAGAADLERHSSLLDEINVFPVMDADTGANMSAALVGIRAEESSLKALALRDLPAAVEAPLAACARGNSGIILAQYLLGFFNVIGHEDILDFKRFLEAASHGRDMAYRSVSAPREGTILTAMSALRDLLRDCGGAFDLGVHSKLEAELAKAVLSTRDQMPALREAGVPDSGALGFHLLACGLTLAMASAGDMEETAHAMERRRRGDSTALVSALRHGIDKRFLSAARSRASCDERYCVNMLIEACVPKERCVEILKGLGSSANTALFGSGMKVHVHTNAPDRVVKVASSMGKVVSAEIQDMQAALIGFKSAAPDRSYVRFRVAGDSAMSMGREDESSLGIARLPLYINTGGRVTRDTDINMEELMARMSDGHAFTTAQVSPEDVRRFLDEELKNAERLIFIAVGRAYTGTQDTIRRVLDDHPERARVAVVDSRAASGQQGIACAAVARYAAKARDFNDVLRHADAQVALSKEYLVIDDLSYLRRSGRIGRVKSAFALLLSVKPVVGHGGDGAITYAKVRNHDAAIEEIALRVASHPGQGSILAMVEHTGNLDFAERVRKILIERLPAGTEVLLAPLSCASAVHMGPGTWGVAVTRA